MAGLIAAKVASLALLFAAPIVQASLPDARSCASCWETATNQAVTPICVGMNDDDAAACLCEQHNRQTFNTCNTHCKAFPQKMPKNVCRKVAARADDGTAKRDAQGESIIPWQEEEDDDDEHEKRQCVGFLPGLPCHKPHSSTTMTSALTTSTPDSQPEKRQCHPMPGGPCDKPNSSTTTPQPAPSPDNKVKKSPPGPDCVPFPGAACDKPNSSTTTSQSAATTDNKAEKRQPDRCNLMPGGACNTNADQ